MSNPFAGRVGLGGPASDLIPVTPSDSADLAKMAIALYITVGGVVVFVSADGNTRTVTVPDNFTLTCGAKRVLSTGTTATGIHAFTVS